MGQQVISDDVLDRVLDRTTDLTTAQFSEQFRVTVHKAASAESLLGSLAKQ